MSVEQLVVPEVFLSALCSSADLIEQLHLANVDFWRKTKKEKAVDNLMFLS